MAVQINSLTNVNIYVDGNNYIGKAKEVQVPEQAFKMVDHEALGMVGMVELFAGLDKMEATIQWNSTYADALAKAVNPNQPLNMQVRGNLRVRDSTGLVDEQAVVITMNAQPKNMPGMNFKQHENVELESKFNVSYYLLSINGEEIYEIDLLANVFRVNGVDIMAKYRQNLGL